MYKAIVHQVNSNVFSLIHFIRICIAQPQQRVFLKQFLKQVAII